MHKMKKSLKKRYLWERRVVLSYYVNKKRSFWSFFFLGEKKKRMRKVSKSRKQVLELRQTAGGVIQETVVIGFGFQNTTEKNRK